MFPSPIILLSQGGSKYTSFKAAHGVDNVFVFASSTQPFAEPSSWPAAEGVDFSIQNPDHRLTKDGDLRMLLFYIGNPGSLEKLNQELRKLIQALSVGVSGSVCGRTVKMPVAVVSRTHQRGRGDPARKPGNKATVTPLRLKRWPIFDIELSAEIWSTGFLPTSTE